MSFLRKLSVATSLVLLVSHSALAEELVSKLSPWMYTPGEYPSMAYFGELRVDVEAGTAEADIERFRNCAFDQMCPKDMPPPFYLRGRILKVEKNSNDVVRITVEGGNHHGSPAREGETFVIVDRSNAKATTRCPAPALTITYGDRVFHGTGLVPRSELDRPRGGEGIKSSRGFCPGVGF